MAEIHPTTRAILGWAKRAAIARKRDRLSVADLLCGVSVLADDPTFAQTLRRSAGWADGGDLRWPDEVVRARADASGVEATERTFQFEPDVKRVLDEAWRRDAAFPPAELLRHLFLHSDPLVQRTHELNGAPPAPPRSAVVGLLEGVTEETARLSERLRRDVLGQEPAIEMLADAYFRARVGGGGGGPRGIFTFLGPPGTGKTLLAEVFAQALGELDEKGYGLLRFDMGAFQGANVLGDLMKEVTERPRTVVLFDEIEKAPLQVLQSLLAVLDREQTSDRRMSRPVTYRDCWFVFTTNLAQEVFDQDNQAGVLQSLRRAPGVVFEILASARPRPEPGRDATKPALPPEFVSRLAKGGAVVFRSLETRHFLEIVERQFALARGADRAALPAVSMDAEAKLLFLLGMLPNIDARRVAARAATWSTELIRRSYRELRHEIAPENPEGFSIDVVCGSDARALVESKLGGVEVRVLLVDDDARLPALIAPTGGESRVSVRRVTGADEAADALQRAAHDLVLLDLSIGEEPTSADVEKGLAIHRRLRSEFPDIPVYLFSEDPERRGAFDEVVQRVMQQGGARAYLPVRRDGRNPLEREDLVARVQAELQEVRRSKVMLAERRTHRATSWEIGFRWDSRRRRVIGEVGDVSTAVAYGAEDPSEPIRFSGIPEDRFRDVIGVARAKRRLGEVLAWLKDPARLGAFAVGPPRGYLLAGPPGTGKTLLARAFAGEAGLPFFGLSAGEFQSKFYGETEERIRSVFRRAQAYAPSIVFIDEIDGIARRRNAQDQQYAYAILNQLLTCMDGFKRSSHPVFVLAATNKPDELDPAIRRPGRFDEVIPVDRPNAADREAFFRARLAKIPIEADVDHRRLAEGTVGLSPAELDRIVREAIYAAAAAGRKRVDGATLDAARRLVRFGAESEAIEMHEDERRVTAFHEAGHAVAQIVCFPKARIDHLTIVPNERGALGFMAPLGEEGRYSVTRSDLRRRIVVALAGREAERLIAAADDDVTSGASSDLQIATANAWHAVSEWGLDTEFGAVSLSSIPEGAREPWAEAARERVAAWLREGEREAADLLRAHRRLLDGLAERLLAEESLDCTRIGEIVASARGG